MTAPDDRPRVHVVDSIDTSAVSDEIIRGLDGLGVDASVPAPEGRVDGDPSSSDLRAVVVLLSERSFDDPAWSRRVEALRAERLVPVLAGPVDDTRVPGFLAELNWVVYRPEDSGFLARLFTGINTDSSRFRDARDTRALAERWAGSGRNLDLLLDDRREIDRRIRSAGISVDGQDPLMPPEVVAMLTGGIRTRYRALFTTLIEDEDVSTHWMARLIAGWMAVFRGIYDKMVSRSGELSVAFLAASRRHVGILRRRRRWRIGYRTALAAVAVVVITVSVAAVQQAVLRSTNAVSFAFGDAASSNRPDLSAIKAGASLAESGTYSGADGRLRVAADAFSQHWPVGYLGTTDWAVASAGFLADGSIVALDNGDSLWRWNIDEGIRTVVQTAASGTAGGDVEASGALFLASDGATLSIGDDSGAVLSTLALTDIRRLRLAPADDRALVQAGDHLYVVDGAGSADPTVEDLGAWTEVLDIVHTAEGHAVALADRDGTLELVGDDGEIRPVGTRPAQTASGALSPNAESFVLEVNDSVWYYSGGTLAPTGIVVPGILEALAVTDDGLVLLADRTRGPWAADVRLGVELGAVCNGSVGTAAFVVDPRGDRVLCLQGATIMIDDLDQLRPVAIGSAPVEPTTRVTSDGPLAAVGLIEGLIRIDRAEGTSFVLDPSGISLGEGYEPPAEISDADFFATGALIGATGIPTTVAATADGSTFAIGFDDGRLIEVDLTQSGSMARVGVWQLPDRSPVSAIAWSEDLNTITASTHAGTVWERSSCAGCFSQDLLYERIAERAWLCYEKGDIDSLGQTARELFALAECETRWRNAS